MLCSKCKKNTAVVFVTKLDNNGNPDANSDNKAEGYCLSCAKKLGLAPVNDLMNQMGLTEEDLDMMNTDMSQLMENMEGMDMSEIMGSEMGDLGNGNADGTSPFGLLNKIFGNMGKNNPMNSIGDGTEPKNIASDQVSDQKTKQAPPKKANKNKKMLDAYGTNLTDKAKLGKVDPVIGRNKEIDRVIQILNRRTKNNPVLLGEPGVGKTAIAEGIACRIIDKTVPAKLLNYEIYLLDFAALVAGTQFRGQFEARLKKLLEEVTELGNIILVIDEIHNIVGAGDAEGAMSAANILKPSLARGEIQVVGATTLNEYRKHIEKDSALERRFQPVMVDEPSIEDSIEILRGIKSYYEVYHTVKIPDDIITKSVILAERYITDRFLPDKAIDVIDEAASKVNLKNAVLVRLAECKNELIDVQEQKEVAVSSDSIEDYQKAAELKIKECQLTDEITRLEQDTSNIVVTEDDICEVIEMWTKIPVQRIGEAESAKLIDLENRIGKRVIGQKKAIEAVSRAIRRGRAGISFKKRPVSFIFVGPTGVGKTELVKTIAEVMFNNEEALIRVDMSEYMEKHAVSKIIGSPPGYVGYDDAGQLTEKVRRNPYSVILLDEIEKAHPDIFNILLQILDDGRISDSHGKIVSFENTIIVMTSNAGTSYKNNSLGFSNSDEDFANEKNVDSALKEIFKPEFLNRIDEIVSFTTLSKVELKKIIELMLADYVKGLKEKNISFVIDESAKEVILEKGYDPKYGARPLRRAIERNIEDKIAELFIRGNLCEGETVNISAQAGEITVNILK